MITFGIDSQVLRIISVEEDGVLIVILNNPEPVVVGMRILFPDIGDERKREISVQKNA